MCARGTSSVEQAWDEGLFCAFGEGMVDFGGVLAELEGFDGWAVVEQDRVAVRVEDLGAVRDVEARNLAVLRRLVSAAHGHGQSGPTSSGRPATALARAATPTATARRSSSRSGPRGPSPRHAAANAASSAA